MRYENATLPLKGDSPYIVSSVMPSHVFKGKTL